MMLFQLGQDSWSYQLEVIIVFILHLQTNYNDQKRKRAKELAISLFY